MQLDECMTFLMAGHETTAVLLTWTVYALTSHPEYIEKARAEVSWLSDLFFLPIPDWFKGPEQPCFFLFP